MRLFQKGDPEYQDNGVYEYEGETWMTLWAFKTINDKPDNTPPKNVIVSKQLTANGCESIDTRPDNDRWGKVKAFKESDLKEHL
ncbi:hypothetical protein E4630_12055 [Aeromonas hydrophila]|uniref:hypothetical protein n=1 Tax=Aeromonas hydrophila TaxID=644 RepID=UPI00107EE7A0|nr:hypothetical protein [Aeromonas hydrophila]QBX71534.1 hypothetical protein E4625_12275 [Aeromonas hydrophila]QBX76234.1 hypothetical protein E4630_12055 [Aeromonas hydrophila]